MSKCYCPQCEREVVVDTYNSRYWKDTGQRLRYHQCRECGASFKTVQITEEEYIGIKKKLDKIEQLIKNFQQETEGC